MYQREIGTELQRLVEGCPVVTVIGPRQSGKTTIVRHVFSGKSYVNLEDPDTRGLANEDPQRLR